MSTAKAHNKEILEELVTALEGLSDEPLLLAPYLADAFYRAAGERGADSSLLSIIGSWGDTLPDDEVLAWLREWNADNSQEERMSAPFKVKKPVGSVPLFVFLQELDDDLSAHVLNTNRRVNVRARVVTDKYGRIWVTREGAELSFEKCVRPPRRQASS